MLFVSVPYFCIMGLLRIYGILLLCALSSSVFGQATQLGTQTVSGAYTSYGLTDLGIFRQVRIQATSGAASGARNWEFYEAPPIMILRGDRGREV